MAQVIPMQIDWDTASRFLHGLLGTDDVTWQTFDDNKERKNNRLASHFHGPVSRVFTQVQNFQRAGAGVFFMVNEGDGKGRSAKNVTRVRCYFVDGDDAPLENGTRLPLKPTAVVETSENRFSWFYRITDAPLDEANFKRTQKALTELFESDDVHDLPRVMRIPGAWHLKGTPYQSRLHFLDPEAKYTEAEFQAALSAALAAKRPSLAAAIMGGLSTPLERPTGIKESGVPGKPGRNVALTQWVGHCFKTMTYDQVLAEAHACNATFLPPMPEAEVLTIVDSIAKREAKKQPEQPAPSQAPGSDILADVWWHGTGGAAQSVPWLVKNVLPETGTALIPGQWGMGKTFVALDLANAVARGNPFANYKCKRRGGVFYIAAEGGPFIPSRLQAIDEKFKLDKRPLPLALLTWCPPLLPPQQLPAFGLFDLCKAMAAKMVEVHGVPLVLIIIDTLSAAHPFKDANDAAEAQKVMNYLAAISRETGALVVAVDHYGKDTDAGTRGSSAKEASADAILAVLGERSQAGVVSKTRIAVRKARGGAQGAETFFTLPITQLGIDEDGEPITACTVEWNPVTARSEVPKAIGDGWPSATGVKVFRAALQLMLDKHGKERRPFPDRPPVRSVELAKVRQEFNARYPNDDAPDAKRKAFTRARDAALGAYVVQTREVEGVDIIWLTRPDIQADKPDTPLVSGPVCPVPGPGQSGQMSGLSGLSGAPVSQEQ